MNTASDPLSQLAQAMGDFLAMLFSFLGDFIRQILTAFLL